jgi:hypothetical protein
MNDFFKYLTPSQEDIRWGLYLQVAGFKKVAPGEAYPSTEHPSGYYFRWHTGRTLNEFQLVFISEGEGIFETSSGTQTLKPGDIIVIHPGTWHRYKPQSSTGWTEMYAGFNGEIARMLMGHPLISKTTVVSCGLKENVLDYYHRIFDTVRFEKPGFQLIASGMVMSLIGRLISNIKYRKLEGTPAESIVEQTKFFMQQNTERKIDFQRVASEKKHQLLRIQKVI